MRSQELRQNVQQLWLQIQETEQRIKDLERSCVDSAGHHWGDVKFDPQYREGYVIPSDLDRGIYLGVDTIVSRTYVPPETTSEWVRVCDKCGTEQRTRKTKEVTKQGSIPGTRAVETVPVFPENWNR